MRPRVSKPDTTQGQLLPFGIEPSDTTNETARDRDYFARAAVGTYSLTSGHSLGIHRQTRGTLNRSRDMVGVNQGHTIKSKYWIYKY